MARCTGDNEDLRLCQLLYFKARKESGEFEKGPWAEELDRVAAEMVDPEEWVQDRNEKVRSLIRMGTVEAP